MRSSTKAISHRRLSFETFEARRVFAAFQGADISNADSDPMGIWSRVDQPDIASSDSFASQRYKLHSLDVSRLREHLSIAPQEGVADHQSWSVISLPSPSGGFENFDFYVSSIMAPELAAQFPEIQTYAGRGLMDPAATIRFDLTPSGFHAQVLSPSGTYYIDPYHLLGEKALYATYFKADAIRAAGFEKEANLDDVLRGEMHSEDASNNFSNDATILASTKVASAEAPVLARSGTQLRTYRAAVAATGEYTAFFGGTVANGQAAIVTAMNRLNGIYENELSIRMQLVANNSSLVYTNASTDPYTNDDGGAMLAQNQTNIRNVIGNANYDIGHVFSTGGGGVAVLGSVGINSRKAQGVTGSPAPIGDSFWVDYVAHEIGHQFGGNHTFNSTTSNCGGSNRNASTAYEPGSGSTIQAYAGICASDDLQPNSDAYFHSVSFDEIIAHVDNVIPTVGTRTATGNAVPTVNAGSDFTIPANTPFVITATGSDTNATNVLTYNWEQRNLGSAQTVTEPDNGSSPLFRSFSPTTNPSRIFPRLSDLLNNTVTIGEKMPLTTRTLNFRATVRDNSLGGGGVNTDDAIVNVVNTGLPFVVTSPNTNVTWPGLSNQIVTWNVAGTTANGINTANVNILLSTDGGQTFPTVIASNVPNDGSQDIEVPNQATSQARVRVQGSGNIFFDISNTNFEIAPEASSVVERRLFYNRAASLVFGDGSGNPLNSIDWQKQALLPGQLTSTVNYSNYLRGLNGLIVDLAGAVGAVSASDFAFATWNGIAVEGFVALSQSSVVSVFPGGGVSSSTRVKLDFADQSIRDTWLRVTVLANGNTGLTINDVFYFGHALGDLGIGNVGTPITVRVNAADTSAVRQNQSIARDSVGISSIHDLNKDGRVNATDTSIVRQNQSSEKLRYFTAPVNRPNVRDSIFASLADTSDLLKDDLQRRKVKRDLGVK